MIASLASIGSCTFANAIEPLINWSSSSLAIQAATLGSLSDMLEFLYWHTIDLHLVICLSHNYRI
ncbi:hypothetical protein WI68_04530 [Burkholderia cepacia]|nr:hypothetical protein WI68_04530 [Burkholderia cepacia]